MGIAIAIGLPLGLLIARYPPWANWVLGLANTVQTVPSLAIFGFLIAVPFLGGIGKTPAIIALAAYALLPIIRNTYTGLSQVDPGLKEAALSLGLSPRQILVEVELPLALTIILAGVRTATVICVGIATIAAAIGGGGLGVFIFRGIATVNNATILAGAIPATLMALGADAGLGWLEQKFAKRSPSHFPSRNSRWRPLIWLALLGFLAFSAWGIIRQPDPSAIAPNGPIVIGSKNFTEQTILGELLAQHIEGNSQLSVDRRFNLGGTFICHEAVKTGQIDGYVEYSGTALTAILKDKPTSDRDRAIKTVRQAYRNLGLAVLSPLGFNNTFAIVIRQADAQKYHLKTLSQAAQYAPQWKAGFGYEFLAREDGFPGLARTYGLKFAQIPQAMEIGLMYRALAERQVDLVAGNSTDGLIDSLKLFVLDDDRHYFPPYEAVPIFNQRTLTKYPQLQPLLERLARSISDEEMRSLNYQVDSQTQSVEDAVKTFLAAKGLVKSQNKVK